jgi:hypothetical protein
MPSSIFLSYARADDEPFVKKLYESLTVQGFRVWWDRVSMPNRALTFLQEIRDAVDRADCLVLVVGPGAMQSDYVHAEWQHALEYCKPVHPVLRLGDYKLLPPELKLLDTPDFRNDGQYAHSLEHLLRHLNEPVAALGRLVAVPELPPHFLPRPGALETLKQPVLADVQRPVVVTGTARRIGLQGMGGIGKSVLAAALARDCNVRRAFPDGVLWLTIGQSPNLTSRQYDLCLSLNSPPPHPFADVNAGRTYLSKVLADKACLLVLDDVWQAEHAQAFDALGAHCRMLLTTRDSELITALGAHECHLEVLPENDALTMMAGWLLPENTPEQEQSERIIQLIDNFPESAREVARECGHLPLALALSAAQVRDGTPWADLLDALREADLEFFDHPHGSILKSLKVSIDALQQTNPDYARYYLELAVFPDDTPVPEATILTLWLRTNDINERNAQKLIRVLASKGLMRVTGEQPNRIIELHDLQHIYLRHVADNLDAMHEELLSMYRASCKGGWQTGPNDGYFFEHLAYHLHMAGRNTELYDLLIGSPDWKETKLSACMGDTSYFADLELALSDFADPLKTEQLQSFMQLHTARQAIQARVSAYDSTDLQTLVWLGREQEALSHARLKNESEARCSGLVAIYEALMENGKTAPELLIEALKAAHDIGDEREQVLAYSNLAVALSKAEDERAFEVFSEAERVAHSIQAVGSQAWALSDLAVALAKVGRCEEAEHLVCGIQDDFYLPHVLSNLASALAQTGYYAEAERVICNIEQNHGGRWEWNRYELAAALTEAGCFQKAERIVLSIEDERILTAALSILARSLAQAEDNIPEMPAAALFLNAQHVARSIKDARERVSALSDLAAALAQAGDGRASDIFREAEMLARNIWDERNQAEAKIVARNLFDERNQAEAEVKQAHALRDLASALIVARNYQEAERVAHTIQNTGMRTAVFSELAATLAQVGHNEEAERVFAQVGIAQHDYQHFEGERWAEILQTLSYALGQAGNYKAAERVAYNIQPEDSRAWALKNLAAALAQAGDYRAAERVAHSIQLEATREHALSDLAVALAQAKHFRRAKKVANTIQAGDGARYRSQAFCGLASALVQVGDRRARSALMDAQTWTFFYYHLWGEQRTADALSNLATIYAQAGNLEEAEGVAHYIQDEYWLVTTFRALGVTLAQIGDRRAGDAFTKAIALVRGIQDERKQTELLHDLAIALAQAGDERATEVFTEALTIARKLGDASALSNLAVALAQAGDERAEEVLTEALAVARSLGDASALSNLAVALAQAGDERAEEVFTEALTESEKVIRSTQEKTLRDSELCSLADPFARAGYYVRAFKILGLIDIDRFIRFVAGRLADAEQIVPELTEMTLHDMVRIASWVSLDWRKIHELLTKT